MKRGLIITGGTLDLEFAGQYLKDHSFDCVVSVDGGLKYTKELDVMPHAIVGDFDTIHKEILDEYRQIHPFFGMSISRRRMRQTQSWRLTQR